MLGLVEKPGKDGHHRSRSDRSNLISVANGETGIDYDYYDAVMAPEPLDLSSKFEKFLIGKSNSANYSAKWKTDFERRPTWCDADLSLQAIKRGTATGNTAALYSRSFIQNCLYNLGCFVQRHSCKVFFVVFILFLLCGLGLRHVRIETDIVKLWVSQDGRLVEELNYFNSVLERYSNETWTEEDDKYLLRDDLDPNMKSRSQDEGGSPGYQVLIQTGNESHPNLLTTEGLKQHLDLVQHLVDIKVEKYGLSWSLSDICFKPGELDIANDSIAYSMKPMLERLIPCIWITPVDCFYEGSKPIGPNPPIDTSSVQGLLSMIVDLPDNVTWGNINPKELITILSDLFDIGTVKDFFLRTGIDAGYLDRPCIDPLDPDCPELSPNYYDECPAMNMLRDNLTTMGKSLDDVLEVEAEKKKGNDALDLLGAFFGLGSEKEENSNSTTGSLTDVVNDTESSSVLSGKECKKYRRSFLKWVRENKDEAETLFGQDKMPKYPDYGKVMKGGCQGFAKNVLNWPKDMIMGGVGTKEDGSITAEALQSVILVSTPTDVYKRLRESEKIMYLKAENDTNPYNASSEWSPEIAEAIISAWQREFTQSIYNHKLNFRVDIDGSITEKRIVHPLASTSISDMLAEYCNFDYTIILLGYFFMLLYAIYSQFRCDSFCLMGVNSFVGLAFAGILTVTFASIAGLGLATWFGIHFNAATTQVLPFLALGVGVDNVFLLLFNYPQAATNMKLSEIGVLMKETGMSILMTSMNHILSFLAGTVLPIPALRSFCLQISILLTFNLIAVMTIYPALIAFDSRRKKDLRRDLCCCLQVPEEHERSHKDTPYGVLMDKPTYHGLVSVSREEDLEDSEVTPGGLQSFLRDYYVPMLQNPCVKIGIIVLSLGLFATCVLGLKYSTMGLDLGDVLPEHTAPAAFLRARDKYFSFYPMSIVLRGDDLDFAHQQHLIENLRRDIGESRFIVKLENGEPSERYWLGLFKEWLEGLQMKLDEAEKEGLLMDFDAHKNTSNELKIAVSMVCSYGSTYNCSRVSDGVKLIDDSGTINEEGFYNYLYAWYEYEPMFYTVSQANFFPKLHKLRQETGSKKYRQFIPPAPQPVYSQIPFYLTGLKDTPEIVEMIREIREICDKYTAAGLDNYPSGIAFTFWEQYLDLTKNLMMAIGYIAFAVFCVISILLFNPWTAGCILVILLMLTVEIAGFLGLCGIKLNPVSAVSLITAVGIGVEFTANVAFAFLTSLGTRNERMGAAIDRVFVPIIHGAMSTFLGILMLGFSEFEFVFKYFFIILFALIAIGLINGLAFFPVLISLFGPPCEIRPSNGSNRLQVPPPYYSEARCKSISFNNYDL